MGLICLYKDTAGNEHNEAYLHYDLETNQQNKTGYIKLVIWKNKESKLLHYRNVDIIKIELNPDSDNFDLNGMLTSLKYDNIKIKAASDIYAKLKTIKMKVGDNVLDLTKSTDDL
jgi:hypothetical protein